jgi:hypothetical protein
MRAADASLRLPSIDRQIVRGRLAARISLEEHWQCQWHPFGASPTGVATREPRELPAMKLVLCTFCIFASAAAFSNCVCADPPPTIVEIPAHVLEDKIRGGKLAQVIGNMNGLAKERGKNNFGIRNLVAGPF